MGWADVAAVGAVVAAVIGAYEAWRRAVDARKRGIHVIHQRAAVSFDGLCTDTFTVRLMGSAVLYEVRLAVWGPGEIADGDAGEVRMVMDAESNPLSCEVSYRLEDVDRV